jgi:DNA-binding winged helix-turn-helix (wHTH) protein/Tfp pilus assembly protein PilF
MRFSFGRFELDEQARALRLDDADQQLQPLVFDLLVYLIRHRDRVVPKDELLSELWDGATVTDGSLQRAVSLLRTALRAGDMEHAVQTFARRGYRFGEALPARASESAQPDGADWEAEGTAALHAGTPELAIAPLERAVAAYEQGADLESAARVTLLLTNCKLEGRDLAVAKGWYQRATSYLSSLPEGKQHGLAAWLASRLALFEGQLDECREHARRAQAIAERLADPDLHCLGLVYQGHIFIAQSEVRHGLSLHDEAGAAALAGRVSPWVGGIVFCSVIWAYLHLGDHHRAGQWTDEFARWCERHASYCYPALCRLHRSEVLAIRGELASAEQEVRRAREQLAASGPFCEGDACRVLGEIRLALGDLDGAEAAFREAYRLGWNPQPGLALMLAARGEPDAAQKQLDRALAQPTWTDGQRRGSMLAVLARVAAMNGQLERAESALAELDASSELLASRASAAERQRARGELAWAKSDLSQAELLLRDSVADWLAVGARLQAAEVRVRLCKLLIAAGDRIAAELELSAAETEFRRVEAAPLLQHCHALRAVLAEVQSRGSSLRQRQ